MSYIHRIKLEAILLKERDMTAAWHIYIYILWSSTGNCIYYLLKCCLENVQIQHTNMKLAHAMLRFGMLLMLSSALNSSVDAQISSICTPACPSGYACANGKCLPVPTKPCNKLCIIGFQCVNGECVKIETCSNGRCPADKICTNGICVPNTVIPCNKLCLRGYQCINGECVPTESNCGGFLCPEGTTCKNGQCTPNIVVCPSDTVYQTNVCTEPRPNAVTCPTVYYIRAPDPRFCGVQADGTRINFAQQCTACKDPTIVYYFNRPCHLVPFVCQTGSTCLDYYCSSSCQTDEECPYDWQMCNQNKCIDRCAVMKCSSGPCKFGQCAYVQPSGSCTLEPVSGCSNTDWTCVGFQCADLCVRQACQPNQQCNQGVCEPLA